MFKLASLLFDDRVIVAKAHVRGKRFEQLVQLARIFSVFSMTGTTAHTNLKKLVAIALFSAAAILCAVSNSAAQSASSNQFNGIGRTATAAEVKAWDIDVRPDLKGLPAGSGKVQDGRR